MFRVTVLLTLCVTQAWGQFPSLRQQFQNLPCLAPLIEKINEESPKTVEEALSLPPYQGPKRMAPREYGEVNFPISSTLAERQELQAWFNQGLGLIHLGAPLEAERCFRKVIALDPKCPMAYWGLMLANESASRRAELYLERAAHLQSGGVRLSRLETACLRAYLDKWDPMGRPYSTLNPEARTQRLSKLDQALEDLTMTFPENREVLALLFRSHTQRLLALGKAPEFIDS